MPLTAGLMISTTVRSDEARKFPVVPVSALIVWVEAEDKGC
jgi:hypothetical protein